MKRNLLMAIGLVAAGSAAFAAASAPWEFRYRPAKTAYAIYGGSLGDEAAPTAGDKKIALWMRDSVAKDMFLAIGPDIKDMCANDGDRVRRRGQIDCVFNPHDGYTCWIGFDLRTGRSIGGVVC